MGPRVSKETPGLEGPQGPKGETGAAGPQGPKGRLDLQGRRDLKERPGLLGPRAPKARQGLRGPKGTKETREKLANGRGDAPEAGLLTVETELYARQDRAVKRAPALALLQAVSDPDNHPVGEAGSPPRPRWKPGNQPQHRRAGSELLQVRTADFIPVNPGRKVSVDNGQKLTNCSFAMIGGKTPILDWYLSDGKSYSYKNVSDGGSVVVPPSHCAYVKVTLSYHGHHGPARGSPREASPRSICLPKPLSARRLRAAVEESASKISELQVFSGQGQKTDCTAGRQPR